MQLVVIRVFGCSHRVHITFFFAFSQAAQFEVWPIPMRVFPPPLPLPTPMPLPPPLPLPTPLPLPLPQSGPLLPLLPLLLPLLFPLPLHFLPLPLPLPLPRPRPLPLLRRFHRLQRRLHLPLLRLLGICAYIICANVCACTAMCTRVRACRYKCICTRAWMCREEHTWGERRLAPNTSCSRFRGSQRGQ